MYSEIQKNKTNKYATNLRLKLLLSMESIYSLLSGKNQLTQI